MKIAILCFLLLTFYPNPTPCQPKRQLVVATAYCLKGHTASGPVTSKIPGGCIALSRDLAQLLDAKFGDIIEVQGVGRFTYADVMPPQHRMKVDIYFPTYRECKVFGVKRQEVWKVE